MRVIKDKSGFLQNNAGSQREAQHLAAGTNELHHNNHISVTGMQVIEAYRTIRKISVSSTWVKPKRPGVWWNAVGFSI